MSFDPEKLRSLRKQNLTMRLLEVDLGTRGVEPAAKMK